MSLTVLSRTATTVMHHIRMIHTDLKPENILFVSGDARVVRTDRGDRYEPLNPDVTGMELEKNDRFTFFLCSLFVVCSFARLLVIVVVFVVYVFLLFVTRTAFCCAIVYLLCVSVYVCLSVFLFVKVVSPPAPDSRCL